MPHPVRTSTPTPADPPAPDGQTPSAPERSATFSEVFAVGEYRALFSASLLSWVGDYLAKAAVTSLVYEQTQSAGAAAAAFAISFAPWLLIGPLLTALAERYPYRNVMIVSDLVRMVLIAIVALFALPLPFVIALLFLTSLGNPPYEASRSALLPYILSGDRLVVGISLNLSAGQAAQVSGYLAGGLMGAINPRGALLLDAVTFAISALVLGLFLKPRPAVNAGQARRNLLRETIDGFRVVFGTPALRGIAVLVFTSMLFAILPEGLAAVWAHNLDPLAPDADRGIRQGLIMLANPAGWVLGGLLVGRLVRPEIRRRLIRPFALLAPLTLVPAIFNPPLPMVCLMAAACGFCIAGMMPAANGLFVMALPHMFRARAFGVMQSGVQLLQGFAVLCTGLLANRWALTTVVGLWSIAGVLLVLLALSAWPSPDRFTAAIAHASRLNEAPANG